MRVVLLVQDPADHERAVLAGVDGDLSGGPGQRPLHDLDAVALVLVLPFQLFERLGSAEQGNAAAWQDAFFDGSARGMQRVVDAVLALLDLDLGGAADADHCNAARELGKPFLQFLAIVVGGGLLDFGLDLANARLNVSLLTSAVDDRRRLLFDPHVLGAAEHADGHVLQLDAEIR